MYCLVNLDKNYDDKSEVESILNATVGDQPTLDDSLGFSPYVEAIKEFLTNHNTIPPLTLSIEGPWGSGKSSFMFQLKKRLDDEGECTVLFNAWRHDKEDVMWAAFALEFIRQISRNLTLYNHLKAEFRLLISRIRWTTKRDDILKITAVIIFTIGYVIYIYINWYNLKNLIPEQLVSIYSLLISSPIFVCILLIGRNLKKLLGNSLSASLKKYIKTPDYENRTTFIEEFHEDFKNIVECYAEGRKVFVFIDDLDRCEVPKAADLMQALNLMISNDPHLIFIIGMDRLKVASGFAVKYERLLPYLQPPEISYTTPVIQNVNYYKGLEYGYEFLEKFVQLPFLIPEPEISSLQEFIYKSNAKTTQRKKVVNYHFNILWDKVRSIRNKTRNTNLKVNNQINNGIDSPSINPEEEQKKVNERIKITVSDNDSPTVRKIIRMVSSTLDNNPRRIKNFINLFRLKTFISCETGLFCTDGGAPSEDELTLEKLGKFVAISLKWPLLVSELNHNPSLLANLQKIAIQSSSDPEVLSDSLNRESNILKPLDVSLDALYWTKQKKLLDLLKYGCFKDGSLNSEEEKIYSMSKIDVKKLLKTSPKTVNVLRIKKFPVRTGERLPEMREILEAQNHEQRLTVITHEEAEHAAEILEEIGPSMQREIISSMKKETVADLIERMTPGQAADVLSILTLEDRTSIMKLMDEENLDKIRSILEKRQDTILNLISVKYLKAQPDEKVETLRKKYSQMARDKDVIAYFHVIDGDNKLLGIINVKELLAADDEVLLKDIMKKNVITLKKESSIKEAEILFSRYGFISLPVIDKNNELLGVIRRREIEKFNLFI